MGLRGRERSGDAAREEACFKWGRTAAGQGGDAAHEEARMHMIHVLAYAVHASIANIQPYLPIWRVLSTPHRKISQPGGDPAGRGRGGLGVAGPASVEEGGGGAGAEKEERLSCCCVGGAAKMD